MPDPAQPPSDGNIGLQILLLFILILFNAFFAASEIAVISLNENKLRKMAEEGHKKAKQILKLTADSSNFLATIQIGVTLAGFLTAASAADALSEPLALWLTGLIPALARYTSAVETVCLVLVTLITSFFSLVLGELVPKRIAMQKAEKLSFAFIGILRVVAVVCRPFVRLLSASTNVIVRLFGIDPHADEERVTEEDIRLLVDVGEEKGVIEGQQRDMLDNIFEFDDITAEDIMTPRVDVEAVETTDTPEEAIRVCVERGYSRLPVYEEDIDHVVGVLYIKDLLPYVGREVPPEVTVHSLMRETYFVPATKKCSNLFGEMSEKHIQMTMVVDEYGGFAGIVTMEDLLESIVGNIQDEYDNEEEEVTKTGDNTYELDGALDIDEVNELLGITLPEGEYDTLAGFLMNELGHIPSAEARESVTAENVVFTVTEMEELRIVTVHAEILPKNDGTDAEADEEKEKKD